MTLFRIFYGTAADVEAQINEWSAALPPTAQVLGAQIACKPSNIYVLVTYEKPEER